jgi:outer membrane protein with beta-barrel domain
MRRLIVLTVLALGTTAAQAESALFYLGAGVTTSSLTVYPDGSASINGPIRTDLNNPSWKAFAGVRPLRWLAVEADYIDLGSGSGSFASTQGSTNTHADSSAWAAYAVGFLPVPLPVVELYGKAGLARWKLNTSITSYPVFYVGPPPVLTSSTSSTSTEFAWGIGVQAHIKMFGARLEYESFNVNGNKDAKVGSLSVLVNF